MTKQEIANEIKMAEDHLAELRKKLETEEKYWLYPVPGTLTYIAKDGPKLHGIDPASVHMQEGRFGGYHWELKRKDGRPAKWVGAPSFAWDAWPSGWAVNSSIGNGGTWEAH